MFVLDDFEGKYQLDLSADKQLGLKNGHSESYSDSIRVKYDFGDFLLIENYTVDDYESEDWSIVGASFDYNNQWEDKNGEVLNIGFDIFDITGVLFKRKLK